MAPPTRKHLADESRNFCILPWVHVKISPNGDLHPCCRMDNSLRYGSLQESSLEDAWNGEAIRKVRRTLMADSPLPQCSECQHTESLGGLSTRRVVNHIFAPALNKLEQTTDEGFLDTEEVEFLDLRLSNVCNFRCRTCSWENSTAWYPEARVLEGGAPSSALRPTKSWEEMRELLEARLPGLRTLYFAGGEPLLQEEHYLLLEILLAKGREDIQLNYNTNFSTLTYRHWNGPDLWRRFKNVNISASFDGVGEKGEFLRKGMNWSRMEANFRELRRVAPEVQFNVFATVSAMNAFHLPEAIQRWIELGMINGSRRFKINLLRDPRYFSIEILNRHERLSLADTYLTFLDRLKPLVDPAVFQAIHSELRLVLGAFTGDCREEEREHFRKRTRQLDELRQESFATLFPELEGLMTGAPDNRG